MKIQALRDFDINKSLEKVGIKYSTKYKEESLSKKLFMSSRRDP